MEKLKFKLRTGAVKELLILHVEKIALAIAIGLMAVFFCWGYSVDSLPDDKTPLALKAQVQRVKSYIAADNWRFLKDSRTPHLRHPERVDEGRLPAAEEDYQVVALDPPLCRQKTRRSDPRLYAPLKLEVTSKWVPLAYVPAKGEIDEVGELPMTLLKSEPKAVRRRTPAPRRPSTGNDLLSTGFEGSDDDEFGDGSASSEAEHRVLTDHQKLILGGMPVSGAAIAKSKFLIAIKAVVPFALQWKEFDELRNTSDYDSKRDVPEYRWFYVERAEVYVDSAIPLDWKRISTRSKGLIDLAKKGGWVAIADELAAPESVDGALTLPVPPVLSGSLIPWALHSEIRQRKEPASEDAGESHVVTADERDGPPEPNARESTKKRGRGRDSQGNFGMIGYGQSDSDTGVKSASSVPPPKYKLIRFYDTSADPGKAYRYRIKVQLFDPNRPFDSKHKPRAESLDPAVQARLKRLDSLERGNRKTFWVESAWSEPSETVYVLYNPPRLLAAGVTPPRETVLPAQGDVKPKFIEKESQATVVASIWDDALAVNVATELSGCRGSVLNATKTVDVLHPVTRQFHSLKDYEFKSGAMLLDLRGGEPLPENRTRRSDKPPEFHAPGEFLILDQFGNLQAGNEFDDVEECRAELFQEDVPAGAVRASQKPDSP